MGRNWRARVRKPARRLTLVVGLVWTATVVAQDAEPQARPVVGEPLRQAIDRYAGINVFSSTRLLPRRLTVLAAPDPAARARTQIRQLLEPHGLTLVMTGPATGHVAVAVRAPPAEGSGTPPPPVPAAPSFVEEVTVYAPFRLDRTRRPQSLARRQLEVIPSVGGDTLRALHVLPGVASDGVSAMHRIRGGASNEVLYRLDGVALHEPFHFAAARSLFAAVNPNVIDSVDVYVSGFPSRFGARLSGVVDMHLVEPQRPWQGSVEASALAAAADARGYAGGWSWLASARRSLVGDVLDELGVAGEENLGIPRFDDELARLRWSGANDEFVLGALRRGERIDVERESTGERARARVAHDDVWARWEHDFGPGLRTTWRASRVTGDRVRSGASEIGELARGRLHERRRFRTSAIAGDWRWTPDRDTEVNAGWSRARHRGVLDASLAARYGPLGAPVRGAAATALDAAFRGGGRSTASYAAVTRALGAAVTGSVGVRHDRQAIAGSRSAEWGVRLALVAQVAPAWQVDVDVGRYVQPQVLHEMRLEDGLTGLDPPQHANRINVGATWSPSPRLQVRVDAYTTRVARPWRRYENLYYGFGLLPELAGDRHAIDADEARSRGFELAASYAGPRLSWKLAYTRARSEERVAGDWRARPWDAPHGVKAHLAWSPGRWRLGVDAAYRSGWPVTPLVARPGQLPAALYTDRLPAYVSLGLHAARTIPVRVGRLEVFADVTNATNRRNVVGYLYDGDLSRRAALSLPIVPSVGVRWSW